MVHPFPSLSPHTYHTDTGIHRLCAVHNEVNRKIHKPEFDCADLDATYDCGCGDAPIGSVPNVDGADADLTGLDLERDLGEDRDTGVRMIKGGR